MDVSAPSRPPLAGVLVVDLTRVLAGPFATLLLAQLGATVVKVEPPGGDDSRAFGPMHDGTSLYFASLNHDKLGIALDLEADADRLVLEELLGVADVLVENFRPGALERLGYGWDALHARWPALIYASISGFGHDGPYRELPAYDAVIQAMGGIMSLTGPQGGAPVRVGVSLGDLAAGLYLALGVTAALHARARGDGGTRVDVGMLDCQVALLENALTTYLQTGVVGQPRGTRHPNIVPFQAYEAADGPLVLAAGNDRLFALLCEAVGSPALAGDPRFATNDDRVANVDALERAINAALARHSVAEWVARLRAAGVPCAPVHSVRDVAHDPQVAARGMIVSVPDGRGGTLRVAGAPLARGPAARPHTPPPVVDGDRAAVLGLVRARRRTPP
jgi:CoA:oxalate CoA-transferase